MSFKFNTNRLELRDWLIEPVAIAPLITFRLVFGAVMVFSTLRFWYLGWIEEHFIDTKFTFKYFGFEWVQLLPPEAMYLLHGFMLIGALGVWLGFYYRFSATLFFLTFTYVWLIDLTYYLNHYYFVSIIAFLLIFVPAHGWFSIDCWRRPCIRQLQTGRWSVVIFKWQIAIVYIYAGLAKINYDWLIAALPLNIWLPANDQLPLIGPLFRWEYTPWLFSWAGMLYDITIIFWLSRPPTRLPAYLSVIVFHGLTGLMFQIGVFPLVMIGATWIYFSENFHERLLAWFCHSSGRTTRHSSGRTTRHSSGRTTRHSSGRTTRHSSGRTTAAAPPRPWLTYLLLAHFAIQLLLPLRHVLYSGNLFWTEEGYRFGWRVMLMEKAGTATFYVKDGASGREGMVFNKEFLSDHQEKQMAMQPDMILQYAHFLKRHYREKGMADPKVRAEIYVTLNARPSRLLIDPALDLTTIEDGWQPKDWILPDKDIEHDSK